MANVWFSVLVLIFVQNVFANDYCPVTSQKILHCDQCMRCGGSWCSQPKNMDEHCMYHVNDDWCDEPESPTLIKTNQQAGNIFEPIYAQKSLFIDKNDQLLFSYNSTVERKVSHNINTTQRLDYVDVGIEPLGCDGSKCNLYIVTKVSPGFCTNKSTDMEFIYVTIKVANMTEQAVIKYHVPCACSCSKEVETQSQQCNGNGDFSCGVCSCYEGWSGNHCDVTKCETKRGDVQCNNPLKDNVACSGNGYCGPCDTCICYSNMRGSQYFDRNNFCSDICMDTSGCEQCLTSGKFGPCARSTHEAECTHDMVLYKYNDTVAAEKDDFDRYEWAGCNNTFKEPECYVEYLAKKTEEGITIMVVKSCNSGATAGALGAAGTKVPLVVGVVGVLAAVLALGGVMLWKHLHATPPMPFSSPDYQNIDAEDCVGENPLYKSPTSTFTNPQFGKC